MESAWLFRHILGQRKAAKTLEVDHASPSECCQIEQDPRQRMPHLAKARTRGLAIWTCGTAAARNGCLTPAAVALASIGVTIAAGMLIGLVSGYDRRADMIIQRFMDAIMSFPTLLLALALIAMLGSSVTNVIIVITVVDTPRMVRIVRSQVLSLREYQFVEAARAIGAPTWRVLLQHIAPNTFAPVIVQATFVFASAVLVEAGLSFLGLGIPPDQPSWGNILALGRTFLQTAVWVAFFPGLILTITVLAINLVGDGLRDALDPKLARRA